MLTPLYDRLIIKPIPEGETAGGIILPEIAKANLPYVYGTVVAAGAGRVMPDGRIQPLVIEVGDTVIFGRRAGLHMPFGDRDEEHVLLNEMEVIAFDRPNVVYPKPLELEVGPTVTITGSVAQEDGRLMVKDAEGRCPKCLCRRQLIPNDDDTRLVFAPHGNSYGDTCSGSGLEPG